MDDWRSFQANPPYRFDGRSWLPLYEVIEWRRQDAPVDAEPSVSSVRNLMRPENAAWNVHGVWWRPVM